MIPPPDGFVPAEDARSSHSTKVSSNACIARSAWVVLRFMLPLRRLVPCLKLWDVCGRYRPLSEPEGSMQTDLRAVHES